MKLEIDSSRLVRRSFRAVAALAATATLAAGMPTQLMHQKLLAPDSNKGHEFGQAVERIPGWVFVTAPFDDEAQFNSGAVYVYSEQPDELILSQKLVPNPANVNTQMGHAVSATSDWLAVSAPVDHSVGILGVGAVHMYKRQGSIWVHQQRLNASNGSPGPWPDKFGSGVAVEGNLLAVGAPFEDTAGPEVGCVYLYELQGNLWVETKILYPGDVEWYATFGESVAIRDDRVFAGAVSMGNGAGIGKSHGSVYVFERDNGTWVQKQKLTASDPKDYSYFGWDLKVDANILLVGALGHKHDTLTSGAVYSFDLVAGTWTEMCELLPEVPSNLLGFGGSIDFENDLLLLGVPGDNDQASSGSALLYRRQGNCWEFAQKMLPPDGNDGDGFAMAVALASSRAVASSRFDDDNGGLHDPFIGDYGSAYVFDLAPDATQFCFCPEIGPCGNSDDFGGCKNSTGHGAVLSAGGSSSIASDDLRMEARYLPGNVVGLLFMGGTSGPHTAFGDGQLCLQPGSAGLYRFLPPIVSDPNGFFSFGPGLASTSLSNPPAGHISAGQTWTFQTWFRDPTGPCGSTYTLSNALSIRFTP